MDLNETKYGVNEIFHSIQGEGRWQGSPATFIRLQGCNVGCPWCDSKSTWRKSDEMLGVFTAPELLKQFIHVNRHTVITGGEPTLHNLQDLILEIRKAISPVFIQLETSGQNKIEGFGIFDWITWSPKEVLNFEAHEDIYLLVNEIKFVVDEPLTISAVHKCLTQRKYPNLKSVAFMPEGSPPTDNTIQYARNMAQIFQDFSSDIYVNVMYADRLQCRLGVK